MTKRDNNELTRAFPKELLTASAEERIAWFESRAVAHDKIKKIGKEIKRMLKGGRRYPVVLVVGPTGIGKSTLLMHLKKEIMTDALPKLREDPGRIPIASVEASAPEMGIFNWRDHYIKCLAQLRDVLILNKIDDNDCDLCRGKNNLSDNPRISAHSFRHALEHALVHRSPAGFFIDEAQHLTKMSSGRRLLDQMDVIKSIANSTHIPHILFGTYDLLALRNLNGQLSRRNSEVHFARYRVNHKEELAEFKKVIRSFENLLPVHEKPTLEKQWEFIYERSLGCVGNLKDWLSRALELALADRSARISSTHLEQSAMSAARCHKIAEEIIVGETRFAEDAKARPKLLSILGLPGRTKTPPVVEEAEDEIVEQTAPERLPNESPLTSTNQKPRPFEQKPKRHSTDPKKRVA